MREGGLSGPPFFVWRWRRIWLKASGEIAAKALSGKNLVTESAHKVCNHPFGRFLSLRDLSKVN
jgi:hypothetical protein